MQSENKFFTTDRGEKELYASAPLDQEILLPVTFDGFEALLERACSVYALPADDSLRSVLAGWIHHMKSDEHATTIQKLANALYKSCSNSCTYLIDQAVKDKKRQEIAIAQNEKKQQEEAERLARIKSGKSKRHLKSVKKTGTKNNGARA